MMALVLARKINMKNLAVYASILLVSGNSYANENWSGKVEKVTVMEDGSANIIISSPSNGLTGTFNCTQNVVYLGIKSTPANSALLSQALSVYVAGKPIRFGVRGTGDSCEAYYITAE